MKILKKMTQVLTFIVIFTGLNHSYSLHSQWKDVETTTWLDGMKNVASDLAADFSGIAETLLEAKVAMQPGVIVRCLLNNKTASLGLIAMAATHMYVNGAPSLPAINIGSVRRWTKNVWQLPLKYPAPAIGLLAIFIANGGIKILR